MKKAIVFLSLLAFLVAGSVAMVFAADKVCCKDGKSVGAKDPAACVKAGGKMVAKGQCKPQPKKK